MTVRSPFGHAETHAVSFRICPAGHAQLSSSALAPCVHSKPETSPRPKLAFGPEEQFFLQRFKSRLKS